uniref:Desmoplakin n=1 Tax=Paramormyrops kingsleyae TaxID=1676925 RepID=A0A3B3RLQ9_9TELE|nr:desmoplakin-like isoform X1 [Paramormyrops kingsleyae]
MSYYGSHERLANIPGRTVYASPTYSRVEVHGGNGFLPSYMDGYSATIGGGAHTDAQVIIQRGRSMKAQQYQDQDNIRTMKKTEYALQSGADHQKYVTRPAEYADHVGFYSHDLRQLGQPSDPIQRSMEQGREQVTRIHQVPMANQATMYRTRTSVSYEDTGRSFQDAMGWITQKKRMIETAPWGDDPATIDQHIMNHSKFQSSINSSMEVDRARDELGQKGDKIGLNALDHEWDSLQKMSYSRLRQLRELQNIIEEISREIIWVNEREEKELVFDWGDKNIDTYIPQKQESYSELMKDLEEKEKDLNKLKQKVDNLHKNSHPAFDKIDAYMDTLQTQWSWLLQITKCLSVHLKENMAYSQFFKEANEINAKLKKDHDNMRMRFACDKSTPLENLMALLKNLEKEKERLLDNKRQVQLLVNKSKGIIRLKPRNPEFRSSNPVIVQALCDFKQDQKAILQGNEGILKDNSQRSKWLVIGPGGLDMLIPSVCLLIPPPNNLSIELAKTNEKYYDALMDVSSQLYINIKSLISWQYCVEDINRINSLTMQLLTRMSPDEYRSIIKSLETHYEEFKRNSQKSELFGDEDKKMIEKQYTTAQTHYDKMIIQLPTYIASANKGVDESVKMEVVQPVASMPVASMPVAPKPDVTQQSTTFLMELHSLRQRAEAAELGLTQNLHVPLKENSAKECSQRIVMIEGIQRDINAIRDEHIRMKEKILRLLEGMTDPDKAKFLQTELAVINQKLGSLEGFSTSYLQRLKALRGLFQSLVQVEDIVKVNEARLTEKETSSLNLQELEDYNVLLKRMKSELDQKRDILKAMETELNNAVQWNNQVGQSFHKCDVDLSKYAETVIQLSDRWQRIQTQIDSRVWDVQKQQQQLKHYQQTSSVLMAWIQNARQRQDVLQANKVNDLQALMDQLNQQRALQTEIKGKKERVDEVQKDANTCASSIKDYELQLASYSAGLETLLNIPIKKTMLQSPADTIREEATELQASYIELFTQSGDFYKFLVEMQKNMEELKIRNTKIDLLEEELRRLKDDVQAKSQKNKSLEDMLTRFELDLSESKQQLFSMEEIKKTQARQCDAVKENLDSTYSQVKDLTDQVTRLTFMLDDEKRKKRLAEERYVTQQEEYENLMRKRQKELDEINWSKIEIEKTIKDKDREIERLKMQLEDEASRRRQFESEISKVRNQYNQDITNLRKTHETEIHVSKTTMQKITLAKEEDSEALKLQNDNLMTEKKALEEELRRLQYSISQAENLRKRAEADVHQQKSVGLQDSTKIRELEIHIQTITQKRTEDELRQKESMAETMRAIQEKNKQIAVLTQNLELESRRRGALEVENSGLKQTRNELQAKNLAANEVINRLKVIEQELSIVRIDLQTKTHEKYKVEQNSNRLEGRIRDLQKMLDGLEAEVERHRKATLDESALRSMAETDLERTKQSCKEHLCIIDTLKRELEIVSSAAKRNEQQLKNVQEALDRSLKDQKLSSDSTSQLNAQLKALQLQLQQEQGRVKDANLRNEILQKTIEEKSRMLNDNGAEIEKLQKMTQNLTKERLRLDEEVRSLKQEKEELKKNQHNSNNEAMAQMSSLQSQLQSCNIRTVEHQAHINELSKERDRLKMEIEKSQKQAFETSSIVTQSQANYNEILKEKDSLAMKIKLLEQDKARMQRSEEELNRIKLSLEGELQQKKRILDENEKVKRDFSYWKSQYELKETHIRQQVSDKDQLERERNSLRSEIERLMAELKSVEAQYKNRLTITEKEVSDITLVKSNLEKELWKLKQRPASYNQQTQTSEDIAKVDPSKLLFNGVHRKVTAHQLSDCKIIDQVTLDKLLKGQKTVDEVAVNIQPSLQGAGVIAGVVAGTQGKMSINEAKQKNLLPPEAAVMLLEAQAAAGYIIDPKVNEKMSVDMACSRGLVDRQDKDVLITAEAASTGFKDPYTGKLLSAGQTLKKGQLNRDTVIRLLQAQESVGGILDPALSVFLSKDTALERNLIDEDLYRALNKRPACYIDPHTTQKISYNDLKMKCHPEPVTGLLLLNLPDKSMSLKGFRGDVSIEELVESKLLTRLEAEEMPIDEIENKLRPYLRGSTCIAGIYHEAQDRILPIYQAMKDGLLTRGTALELLEAQAASGFVIDPLNNLYLTVEEAFRRGLVGKDFKEKLLSAERAVTGYKDPHTGKTISLFQAMKKELIEKGHGIRLLEAQIASGGIIDPNGNHRIDVDVAYSRGYFDKEMNDILNYEGDDTKGFFDPNTHENLTYIQLKRRCITDKTTGLVMLPLKDKKKKAEMEKMQNVLRKRRVVIVDPDTGSEMTVREAYHRELIDYDTFLELCDHECEWEEITITASDGSSRLVLVDRKSGQQFDVQDSINRGVINQSMLDKYRTGKMTIKELADKMTSKSNSELSITSSSREDVNACSSPVQLAPLSPTVKKRLSSVSITLSPPSEILDDQSPVAAIFDSETLQKITIAEGLRRGIVDSITAQRLLEAQACTGGIFNPATGKKLSLKDAVNQKIIDEDMSAHLKPAQKAFHGFEDVKTRKKMSVAEAMKEKWLPHEAGQRFLEFQYLTGGLIEPQTGLRVNIEEAIRRGWLDGRSAQKLQDTRNHSRNLTCPKTKLKISYKEAMDSCMVEEDNGVKMLQATSMSTKGISSPYNVASGPSSRQGSRSGSRSGSRRGSVDLSPTVSFSFNSFSSKSYS